MMNNAINYSGFVEMCLDSNDDFEPYGCAVLPQGAHEHAETMRSGQATYSVQIPEEE
jgi:hypothetical protein